LLKIESKVYAEWFLLNPTKLLLESKPVALTGGGQPAHLLASAVAITASWVAVGAPGKVSGVGIVFVFKLTAVDMTDATDTPGTVDESAPTAPHCFSYHQLMVTRFVASLPTDNSPQRKEACFTL
jgi:hypothetical protein